MKFTLNHPEPHKPVILRFALPFCLHMKDGEYEVLLEDRLYSVETTKVWRDSENCADDDEVHEEARFFETGNLRIVEVGGNPDDVREIGQNVELRDDPTGRFRFTRVAIGFMVPSETDIGDESLFETALAIANRFVDVYRHVSGRAYLPPVRSQDVRYIETVDVLSTEMVFTGNTAQGLQIALVNERRDVQDMVRARLKSGTPVPLHAEILLTAERMALEGLRRHAAIDAVTALEVYLQQTLSDLLVATGTMTQEELDFLLGGGNLSDALKKPLEKAIGWRLSADDDLWARWLQANRIRRDTEGSRQSRLTTSSIRCEQSSQQSSSGEQSKGGRAGS